MKKAINDYDIYIIKESKKNILLQSLEENKLIKKKIITLEELKRKYYYDYNKEAIYYLIKKYNYQYDVAKMYLSHLIETEKTNITTPKIELIKNIKKELEEKRLLTTYPYFKEYLKNKKILVYDKEELTRTYQKILKEIEKTSIIDYIEEEKETYQHEEIIECETKEQEVSYVASQIAKKIKEQTPITKIKVYAEKEYESSIKRIFNWFNIPISTPKTSLYKTEIGQYFLRNLSTSKKESLESLEKKYPLTNPNNLEIYNQIINIINNYTWCESLTEIKLFLEEDFKTTKINTPTNENTIEIINSLDTITEEDEIFILGFNQGEIPRTYKDEDYFSDKEKKQLELETSDELNQKNYNLWLNKIKQIKNLTITMKKNNGNGECYLSSLNDSLNLKLVKKETTYHHSNLYNKLQLTSKLDTLIRYNEIEKDLNILYNHYNTINYRTYNNNYQQIDSNKIKEYLKYQLNLSYSSINTYYQCAFRYYLNNILKLNIYEETFYTILGNLFHHVLSQAFTKKIIIKEEYNKYLDEIDYPFNAREKYFIDTLEQELEFIINTINKQNEENTLKNIYTEEKISITKKYEDLNITFKGFVDKMMLNDKLDEIAIIDYKTGTPDLNLNHIIYGLDLQLPIYIYLALYKFKNARVVGFYLQKILNNKLTKDNQKDYLKRKEETLKLQGYSNSDLSLLKDFDPNYQNSNMIKGMRMSSKGLSSSKIFDDIKIEKLKEITEQKINEAIKEISKANFDINPKRIGKENLGCKYCNFKDICFMTEKNIIDLKEYTNMEFLGGEESDTKETN